jgi:hypothetical protein
MLLALLVLLGAGWLAVTLGNRTPATATASSSAPTLQPPSPAGGASPEPSRTVPPTDVLPPLITALPGAPSEPFPVQVNELAWVNPAMSTVVSSLTDDWTQWPFLLTNGSAVCVCLEPRQVNGTSNILRLLTLGPGGTVTSEQRYTDWVATATEQPFFLDVALGRDADSVFLLTAIQGETAWSFHVEEGSLADGRAVRSIEVGSIANEDLPAGGIRSLDLWLAPDDRHAVVSVGWSDSRPFDAPPAESRRWLVSMKDGAVAVRRFGVPGGDRESCLAVGWATPEDFATTCYVTSGEELEVVVRRDSIDGTSGEVSLGGSTDPGAVRWLLDATNGRLFGWNPVSLEISRTVFPTLAVVSRPVHFRPDGSTVDPEGEVPPSTSDRIRWSVRTSSGPSTLAGSIDGRVLYAAGWDAPNARAEDDPTAGIFLFDTEALRFIGRWSPAGTSNELAMSADGAFVYTVGGPDLPELERYGNLGPQLVVHDAATGEVVLILRRIQIRFGNVPSLLTPQPAPIVRFGVR